MTDKELLEMAAKAAGFSLIWHKDGKNKDYCCLDDVIENGVWNPLTYDGDALRLAVDCGIDLFFGDDNVQAVSPLRDESPFGDSDSCHEKYKQDAFAATRRAIVRSAAEIGKMSK